jgi:hypothetical protein
MLAGGGRGATMQQRNFALELESNVKKVTESYRNLLNGAKVSVKLAASTGVRWLSGPCNAMERMSECK